MESLFLCLAKNELFVGVESELVRRVADRSRWRHLEPGEVLLALGEEATAAFAIQAGEVALTVPLQFGDEVRTITAEVKGAGAMVAWSALVPPYLSTLGVHSKTAADVVAVERSALAQLFEEHPALRAGVMANLARVIASRLGQWQAIALRSLSEEAQARAGA